MIEGFRFARHTTPVRAILMLIGLVSLAATPYSVLMPIFAGRILHGDARQLGMLMGATGHWRSHRGSLTLASRRGREGPGTLGVGRRQQD